MLLHRGEICGFSGTFTLMSCPPPTFRVRNGEFSFYPIKEGRWLNALFIGAVIEKASAVR